VRTRGERRVGYDFTFSVPKSVSLLYALSGDQGILDAFRGAVDETMREMEAEMKTRIRMGGKDEDRVTGNMVWAEFIHTTSRPVDGISVSSIRPRSWLSRQVGDRYRKRLTKLKNPCYEGENSVRGATGSRKWGMRLWMARVESRTAINRGEFCPRA
jgi:hypothetical protein